ncbi:MAG: hypothetical protein ABIP36_08660 [Acidimicrobiales bacterium]
MEITCPRCAAGVDERYYGPCAECRQALRTAAQGGPRPVEVAAYEPAMHVTPNAVALKE